MKRKALIGLGQSGSAVVEDIAPYASGFDVYCINSSEINGRFLKKFLRETGISSVWKQVLLENLKKLRVI